MEKKFFLFGLLVILMVGLIGALGESKPSNQAEEKRIVSFEGGQIKIEIADNDQERQKGLSGRENLARDEGLLFVFEKPDFYGFWMKDMRFSIDIIWLDENLTVVHIEKNIPSETFPTIFTSPLPAQYVLELNAGSAEEFGLAFGSKLTINNLND